LGPKPPGWRLIAANTIRRNATPRVNDRRDSHFAKVGSPMPSLLISPYVLTIVLLVGSNVFMTTAWYWHLRFREVPLWQVVLISWGLSFFEYCLAVPANRYGSYVYSAAQLKTIQEVITLAVFAVFSVVYLQQAITWNQVIGFALIAGAHFSFFVLPSDCSRTSSRGASFYFKPK
jgi:hypothetical protein